MLCLTSLFKQSRNRVCFHSSYPVNTLDNDSLDNPPEQDMWNYKLGKCNLPSVELPGRFDESAKLFLQDKDKVILKTVHEKLSDFLLSRRVCVSNDKFAKVPSQSWFEKSQVKKFLGEEFASSQEKKVKSASYVWKQMVYDEYNTAAHLIGRTPAVYAAILRILTEISRRNEDFVPQSMLDFGSGSGTSVWAANKLWAEHIKQYVCVDQSTYMNKLALFIFTGGNPNQHLPSIFIRQYLPISFQTSYDVVISSYALSELPSEKDRINILKLLWTKTNRFLVIVEHGNFYGYYIIQEARNLFLNGLEGVDPKKSRTWKNFKSGTQVFSPCPHEEICPKWEEAKGCNFSQSYILPNYARKYRNISNNNEKFSYVVFDKMSGDMFRWPRVVQETRKQNKCFHCHLCTSQGKIKHFGITKEKHGKNLRNMAKVLKPGDCFPISDEYLNFD